MPTSDPLTITRLRPPEPSLVYPVLWEFASKRHDIYLRRLLGQPYPWTDDPVLSTYKFTNSFRVLDRVSQYFVAMIYSEPTASEESLFLRTILFKTFNRIDTWESIVRNFGLPTASNFDFAACEALLSRMRDRKIPIYSAAYIMPPSKKREQKHHMHLEMIQQMLRSGLPAKLATQPSLEGVYRSLLCWRTLGPFLSFQYSIDLNYSTMINHKEYEFVVPGPGALDGLAKCFNSLGGYCPSDTIKWMTDRQAREFERSNVSFEGLWGRPLQPVDIQNVLCEVSKYTRMTHPQVVGLSRRKRIKQRFRQTGPLRPPFFPPKWAINDNVSEWLAKNTPHRTPDLFELHLL